MCLSARRRSTCPAAGFGIGIATTYRYIREAVDVLAGLAPTLARAVHAARIKVFVILDGTLLPIDRIAADTPYYSGKNKRHDMNVQVLTDPFGRLLWASPALRGSTHDLTAARVHGIVEALAEGGLKCWADKADAVVMGLGSSASTLWSVQAVRAVAVSRIRGASQGSLRQIGTDAWS